MRLRAFLSAAILQTFGAMDVRRSVIVSRILVMPLVFAGLSGCSLLPWRKARGDREHGFLTYWPPPPGNTQPRLAVKDNIDMKGVVTTAGSKFFQKNHPPAQKDASCLAIARKRNVPIVGKVLLSEFAVAPSGINDYFGTPRNPFDGWFRRIPGGSSSGSAESVASGMADVSFGTDTAGSVRVPAACCGVVGLKTTFGLVPIDGVYPIEPHHLDTVGPLARNVSDTAVGMDLLQEGFAGRYQTAVATKPSGQAIRVGRLRLKGTDPRIDKSIDEALQRAGFKVVELGGPLAQRWEKATDDANTVATTGAWLSGWKYRLAPGVSTRTKAAILAGRLTYRTTYKGALRRREDWQQTLKETFKHVDFIALPTMQTFPPRFPQLHDIPILEARMLRIQNTAAVNYAGNPAVALPVKARHAPVPVTSLQLVGPRLSEAELLNAARLVEANQRHK